MSQEIGTLQCDSGDFRHVEVVTLKRVRNGEIIAEGFVWSDGIVTIRVEGPEPNIRHPFTFNSIDDLRLRCTRGAQFEGCYVARMMLP